MLRTLSGAAGRLAVVIAGAGLGFVEILRATADNAGVSPRLMEAEGKLSQIGVVVNDLAAKTAEMDRQLNMRMTRDDFDEAVNRTIARLESDVESRIEQQTRAIDALRTTVLQTDVLLQRVLEGLGRQPAGNPDESDRIED